MKYPIIVLLLMVIVAVGGAQAQDTLMLMRGKRLTVSNVEISVTAKGDTVVNYQIDGKNKHKSIDKVFSIITVDGERVLYTQPDEEGSLTTEQMRMFLQGKADYRHGFSLPFYAGGVASMATAAVIPPIGIDIGSNHTSLSLGILVPFAYVLIAGSTTRSAQKLKEANPDLPDNEYYIMGVQTIIGQQRMRDCALGAVTGAVVWFVLSCANFID